MTKPELENLAAVRLAANLDLLAAKPLHQELMALRGKPVRIDGSGVERLGAQCLQVMLAAAAAWKMEGMALQLDDASPALIEGLELLGFHPSALTTMERMP